MNRLQSWAERLRRDVLTLWFALRNPGTPWPARILAALVTAYALSPIDLIPDFIPVLGLLDDLLLIPLGVWLFLKIVPEPVLDASREEAIRWLAGNGGRPRSTAGVFLVLGIWATTILIGVWLFWN